MSEKFDLAIVGGGPGGYVAAIRAGQRGLRTVLIEKEDLGGECLNHGCIPSKALVHVAETYASLGELKSMGIAVTGGTLDWPTALAWKDRIVKRLTLGTASLLKAARVTVVNGRASLLDSQTLRAVNAAGEQRFTAGHIILATGALPIEAPGLPFDGQYVIGNREALALPTIPPRLIVIGGGYIGMELGMVFAKLGSAVTVVEWLDGLLPGHPRDAVKVLERTIRRLKIKALVHTKATGVVIEDGVVKLTVADAKGVTQVLEAEKVLVTVGRRPNTADLGLENTRVGRDKRGFIEVDDQRRTADPHIYAIGDITPGPMLAHKASAEGLVAVAAILGEPAAFRSHAIPGVVFTDPEIAAVGLTLDQATGQGIAAGEAVFPYIALGRALTMGTTDGYFRWIFAKDDQRVLGCEIVGREASNLISEAVLAIEKGLTLHDVAAAIHPHPTLGEGLHEAAESGLGRPIHIPKK
jgi:dihydrolipoamide dehydrogenase